MKKFLAIISFVLLTCILYSAPPVEVVNSTSAPVNVKIVSYKQPVSVEIYNFTVSSTTAIKVLSKDWGYTYFYITNYNPDYDLEISTSPTFTTIYRLLPDGGTYASNVLTDLYARVQPGGSAGFVAVLIEK